MKKSANQYSAQNIGPKVLIALVLAIVFLVTAVYITRYTFQDVNDSIARLALTNEKNKRLNEFYSLYGEFERSHQAPLIANPNADTENYYAQLDSLHQFIDTAIIQIDFSPTEIIILDSIQDMIKSQDQRLMQYRAFKRMEQPALQKNLDSLINLITSEELLLESDVITTRKSTRIIPASPGEVEDEEAPKKNFFQRLFSNDKEQEEKTKPAKPEVIEETYIRIDTVPLARSDTSKAKAGTIIKEIKRDHASQKRRVREIEMEIVQGSARIQNFILSMIRNLEEIELARINNESKAAEARMETALTQMYFILAAFSILATLLVLRILTDLSRAKYYRLQLVAEKERAEDLSKIKERFLANISHELRTPLQNILGYSEKLLAKEDNNDVKIIHQSSEHLLQIINQVLDFSRISTGKLIFNPKVVNLKALFDEVVNSMNIQASRKNIRILFEAEIHHPKVYIDPFRLRQILYNLVGNAVKFTEEGFVKLFVKTEEREDGVHLFFSVEDTGIGMTEEELGLIFHEFEQVGTPEHVISGTGLGLSITKALVEAQNGKIEVQSEENKGSTFTIDITLDPIPEMEEKLNEIEMMPRVEKVLVVDDDKVILNLTTQTLSEVGIEVTAVSSPHEAIEIAKNNKFDMALVDYRMPGMNGAEVCNHLKEIAPNMPVVAVTANVFSENGDETSFKFDHYLPKPYKTSELLALVGHQIIEGNDNPGNKLKQRLNKITHGDEELTKELLNQFVNDSLNDMNSLIDSIEKQELKEAHRIAHTLAGRLSFFEFDQLAMSYKEVENKLHKHQPFTTEEREKLFETNRNLKTALEAL